MKIRTRIIWLLSSTFVLFILVFGAVIYSLVSNYSFSDFYDRLRTRTNATINIRVDHSGDKVYLERFKKQYLAVLPEEKDYILRLDKNNKILDFQKGKFDSEFIDKIIQNKNARSRNEDVFLYGKYHVSKKGKHFIVVTSAKNAYYERYTNYLRSLLLISIGCSILLIVIVSIWLSKRLVRPLNKITSDIRSIGTENLHVRIDNRKQENDELGELMETLNFLFDRLETSFESQNNFISNASHELNTPLTSIIGQADLALYRERSAEEYKKALETILVESEKLDQKIKALLFLAQTGFDGNKVGFERLQIDQLIYDTLENVKRIVPENQIRFDFESLPRTTEDLAVKGNEQLLTLALSNVFLNAYKYSENKVVKVFLKESVSKLEIHVYDNGIGIPEEELAYIYDPFFRASNTGGFEGYGIGLPLTRNIIRIHKGKLILQSKEGEGTKVIIQLLKMKEHG